MLPPLKKKKKNYFQVTSSSSAEIEDAYATVHSWIDEVREKVV